ncbi:MAG: threonine--tRNA ligase, partial [Paludibacter sp.]
MINITFPDGSVRQYEKNTTGYEIAKGISPRLAKEVLSMSVNEKIYDLTRPITEDASIKLYKWEDDLGKKAFWHSSAHLLAQAIVHFFPDAKLTIGPAIESGFYYDVDFGDK